MHIESINFEKYVTNSNIGGIVMLCQSCGKNQANTHIKRIINGELTEYMLCEKCAAKLGYSNIFENFGFDFDNLLGSFFANDKSKLVQLNNKRCDFCGASFEDISNTGKVGCANCYKVFFEQLMPSIKRIHGNTKHAGKYASIAGEKSVLENQIKNLKERMKVAINEQNFEEAAKIRDELKSLNEKEGLNNE